MNEPEEDGHCVAPDPTHGGQRGDGEEERGILEKRKAEEDGDAAGQPDGVDGCAVAIDAAPEG